MFRRDYYGDQFKWFIGIVKEIHPDKQRARVRVFGIHHIEDQANISDGDLPWAIITYPVNAQSHHALHHGDWVVGFFADGEDCQQPVITGYFPGGEYASSGYNGGPEWNGDRGSGSTSSGGNGSTGDGGWTGGSPKDVDTTATMNIPGGSNIEKSYNFFYNNLVKNNLSTEPHLHSSAFVGVLMLETSGINPAVVGGYKGRAWGIAQWLGDRRDQLFATYGQTKDLGEQLSFIWWELNNTEKGARNAWLSATNLPDAVAGAAQFERAEEWRNINGRYQIDRNHGNFQKRLKFAYQVYNSAKPTMPATSQTPSSGFGPQ